MHKVHLSNGPLRWPEGCAACGAPATTTVETTCSVVTGVGYYVLFIRTTHLRMRLTYPVCRRHAGIARVAGVVSARNLFNLALGVAWAYSALGLVAAAYMWLSSRQPPNEGALFWFGAIFVSGLAAYFLARRFTPVRLNGATQDTTTLSIANDRYADEFMRLNATSVLKEVPWWRR